MTDPKYRVLLADDYASFRAELKRFLEEKADLQVIGEANDGLDLLDFLRNTTPDLVILDVAMPRLTGIEAMQQISSTYPNLNVLMLSVHKDEEFFRQAILAGAKGYLLKGDLDELLPAIELIRNGGVYIPRFI